MTCCDGSVRAAHRSVAAGEGFESPRHPDPDPRDVWAICDCGWDGYVPYGPYTEKDARAQFLNQGDVLVRVLPGRTGFEPMDFDA